MTLFPPCYETYDSVKGSPRVSRGVAMDDVAALRKVVDALSQMARRSHYDCDDNWYACPLSNSGCSDPMYAKDECNCGAAEHNRQVDAILATVAKEVQ